MVLEILIDLKGSAGGGKVGSSSIANRLFRAISGLPFPFLLESSGGVADKCGRYTFMGADPFLTLKSKDGKVTLNRGEGDVAAHVDPLQVLHESLSEFSRPPHQHIPFCGGAVGYIGYEAGGLIERLPERKRDIVNLPDIYFNFYDTMFIIDHLEGLVYIASTGFPESGHKRKKRSSERAAFFKEIALEEKDADMERPVAGRLTSNFSRGAYMDAVERIKEYIEAGDIYQANLSQRFSAKFRGSAFPVYEKMRKVNPVPFGAYLDFPELTVISNSPERFLSLRNGRLETRPIKGTIRRGGGESDDETACRLLESSKDGAEHLMIVDLERNDLGRVCRYGSVTVDELKRIDSYSNLHHMVSIISGEIKESVSPVDCIRAAFPGGSITGVPKVRAMEIIHEVEPSPRWLYTGSIGYIGFDGSMDMNIAIRTAFIAAGKIYFSVGGGIVADSDPAAEYEETLLKGEVFKKIISDFEG